MKPDQIFVIDRQGKVSQYSHPEWKNQKRAFESAKKFTYDLYRAYFHTKDKTQKNTLPKISLIPNGHQITIYKNNEVKILRVF